MCSMIVEPADDLDSSSPQCMLSPASSTMTSNSSRDYRRSSEMIFSVFLQRSLSASDEPQKKDYFRKVISFNSSQNGSSNFFFNQEIPVFYSATQTRHASADTNYLSPVSDISSATQTRHCSAGATLPQPHYQPYQFPCEASTLPSPNPMDKLPNESLPSYNKSNSAPATMLNSVTAQGKLTSQQWGAGSKSKKSKKKSILSSTQVEKVVQRLGDFVTSHSRQKSGDSKFKSIKYRLARTLRRQPSGDADDELEGVDSTKKMKKNKKKHLRSTNEKPIRPTSMPTVEAVAAESDKRDRLTSVDESTVCDGFVDEVLDDTLILSDATPEKQNDRHESDDQVVPDVMDTSVTQPTTPEQENPPSDVNIDRICEQLIQMSERWKLNDSRLNSPPTSDNSCPPSNTSTDNDHLNNPPLDKSPINRVLREEFINQLRAQTNYQLFRRILSDVLPRPTSWMSVAFIFNFVRFLLEVSHHSSNVEEGHRLYEFAVRCFDEMYLPFVNQNGGWESLHDDSEVD